jgi:hypothetical protein
MTNISLNKMVKTLRDLAIVSKKVPEGWAFIDWEQDGKIWKDIVPFDSLESYWLHDTDVNIKLIQISEEDFQEKILVVQ